MDALFGYLCQVLPVQTVRQALLADYVSSGARASPQALRGWLPRMTDGTGTVASTLKARQHRHSR